MALDAADAVGHVRRVIEVDELRELVDALPPDRLVAEPALARPAGALADSCQTWLWQFMHTAVGGAPAYFERSAS